MSFFCFSRRVREMCFWQSAQNVHYILYIPQAHKSPSFGFRIAGALPRLFSNCAGRRGIRTILYPVRFKLIGTKIYLVDSPVIEKWVLRVWRGVGGGITRRLPKRHDAFKSTNTVKQRVNIKYQ